ncbi:hypothetical protein EX30DRAFT_348813 [Ascodesmis nigricans]|uniref:Uncharacterized protein n=1 Tax=Ascodesmis nigricans TaxID=341454 RepID=A0A4S2MX57_9PEZI|nr:hypothetical protein EX30DRAFT_348813 [Ascodesmis nigricans]
MAGHPENSPYFKKFYPSWDIMDFLDYTHATADNFQEDLFHWTRSLEAIANCENNQSASSDVFPESASSDVFPESASSDVFPESASSDVSPESASSGFCSLQALFAFRVSELCPTADQKQQDKNAVRRRFGLRERIPRGSKRPARDNSSASTDDTNTSATATKKIRLDHNGSVNNGTMNNTVNIYCQSRAAKDGVAPERATHTNPTDEDHPDGYCSSSTDPDSNSIPWSVEYAEFMNLYASISDKSMWLLSTNRRVETIIRDVVAKMAKDDFKGSPLRFFILDPCDQAMNKFFAEAELDEIRNVFPSLPAPNTELHEAIKPFFAAKTTSDLLVLLDNGHPVWPQPHDENHVAFWVDIVLRVIRRLFSSPNHVLTMPNLEGWYTVRIWSHVIDEAFTSVPSVILARSESVCRASSFLLNQGRTNTGGAANRQKLGPKVDGIIRTTTPDYLELGAIEVAKSYDGPGGTKLIDDGKKLRGVLRDMLLRLHAKVDDEDLVEKLQTVGIINAGLKFQLVRCWGKRKNGVVVCMSETMREFPACMGDLASLWFLLRAVDQAKRIVEEVSRIVLNTNSSRTEEDMSKAFMNGSM